jgi:hypothetical protein
MPKSGKSWAGSDVVLDRSNKCDHQFTHLIDRIESALTTLLIRSRVSLADSDTVRHVIFLGLGLSYFRVVCESSNEVHPCKIPGGSGR